MLLKRYTPATAPESDIPALYRFRLKVLSEQAPHDPLPTFERFVPSFREVPETVDVTIWTYWNEEETDIIARANLAVPRVGENLHLADMEIMVDPAHRRRGIGTQLLRFIAEGARIEKRRSIIVGSCSTVPAGQAFLHRLGAEMALEGQENALRVADVDRSLMRHWIEDGQSRGAAFELHFWSNPYPEEHLEEIARMLEANNTQPFGSLDVQDERFTVDQVRIRDANLKARHMTRWTFVARERASGTIAGFTEIYFHNDDHRKLDQGMTAVLAPYRNHGLGRWLKAAMMEKVLREIPDADVIGTTNATVNAPMLKINTAMGFRQVTTTYLWQVSLETVEAYLTERTGVTASPAGPLSSSGNRTTG